MDLKNILTGWVTSIIGLAIMIASTLDFFGVLEIPSPEGMSEITQIIIGFIVGFALFLIKPGYFEEQLKKIIGKKTDSV